MMDEISVRDWANSLGDEAEAEADQIVRRLQAGWPANIQRLRHLAGMSVALSLVESIAVSMGRLHRSETNGGAK